MIRHVFVSILLCITFLHAQASQNDVLLRNTTLEDPLKIDSIVVDNQTVCQGDSAIMHAYVSGGSGNYQYSWTSNPEGFTSQQSEVQFVPLATSWYVLTLSDEDEMVMDSLRIEVVVVPVLFQSPNVTACNNSQVPAIDFIGSGAIFNGTWTNSNPNIGLPASGTGNIPSFTAHNTSYNNITATITVKPVVSGCIGAPMIFTITVKPSPTMYPVSNKTYCNKTMTTAINFNSSFPGTTFTWSNSNTAIGLDLGGNGSIQPFLAVNSTLNAIIGTITVTPASNGCSGNPVTFTIKVNPTPTLNPVYSMSACNNVATSPVIFNSNIPGSTATWTNSNPGIGLPASGNGNLPSFVPVNLTSNVITSTLSITPVANNCPGNVVNVTLTVYPSPTALQSPDYNVCPGSSVSVQEFTGNQTGTTFTWTNSDISIGLPSSGSGNLPAFTAVNNSSNPVHAVITATPHANNCPGIPMVFEIIVMPKPTLNVPTYQTIQLGASATLTAEAQGVNPPFTFEWSNGMTGPSIVVSPETFTTYTVTVTDNVGCENTAETSVLVVLGNPVVVSIPEVESCPGMVTVPVQISELTEISSISLNLQYNSQQLVYVGYQNVNTLLPPGFFQVNATDQNILVAWFSVYPLTMPGGTLLEIRFIAAPGTADLVWNLGVEGACQVTDLNGSPVPAQFLNGSVQAGGCTGVGGYITYDNSASTTLGGLNVSLKQGETVVAQCVTNAQGYYQFTGIAAGTYTVKVETTLPWGGVNALDASLILQHFTGMITLSPLRTLAADVTANNIVNAADGLLITKRFVGMISSFPSGDWLFRPQTVTINQDEMNVLNIKGICFGDVNGSYIP